MRLFVRGKAAPFFHTLKQDYAAFFFMIALALYGLWGSPTPNNPQGVEAAIFITLLLAVGWRGLIQPFIISHRQPFHPWEMAAKFLLIYGLSVPLIMALVQGHDLPAMARDVIGFILLCLPLFLMRFLENSQPRVKIFITLILFIALCFSLRVLIPHFVLFKPPSELLYLANSPLVLFSAIFTLSIVAQKLFTRVSVRHLLIFIAGVIFATTLILAMFVDIQRASFAALSVTALWLFVLGFVNAPIKTLVPLTVVGVIVIYVMPSLLDIMDNVAMKTAKVGLNMRLQEFQAIWQINAASPFSVLFGQGWGAYFASPAVGHVPVTYSHSLLSYIFWKTGIVGLLITLVYLGCVFVRLLGLLVKSPVIANALVWPFLIPIFLYASHKSFDFGLLLTLILIMAYSYSPKPQEHA